MKDFLYFLEMQMCRDWTRWNAHLHFTHDGKNQREWDESGRTAAFILFCTVGIHKRWIRLLCDCHL